MHEMKQRRRHRSEEDELRGDLAHHPRFSYATWVAAAVAGSAVLGAGVGLYGANRQSQDNARAQEQNAQLQREQNNAAWVNWLMTRGIQPTGKVETGQVPQAGQYTAVNTRLPLWATINVQSSPGPLKVVRRGTPAQTPVLTPATN